jgi:hypothetical protein
MFPALWSSILRSTEWIETSASTEWTVGQFKRSFLAPGVPTFVTYSTTTRSLHNNTTITITMPVSSPLRPVPLATMNSIDNSSNGSTTAPSPHRAPLIHKGSEHSSASATKTPDKQPYSSNTSAASTENPSSAKRPKVDVTAAAAATATTATATVTTAVTIKPLVYPTTVPVPSREIVQSLFEEAILSSKNTNNTDTDTAEDDDNNLITDQQKQATAETDAGLLSFTQVLLPAAAYCEEQALKQLQAVVQRDLPDKSIETVKLCRKAVYDGVSAAMRAAQASRAIRYTADQQREAAWRQDAADKADRERDSAALLQQQEDECHKLELSRQKAELKKKLPRNQELWREVAYLMTEISKLSKEERLWQQAEHNLAAAEQELDRQEQEQLELEQMQDQADMDHAVNDEDNETTTAKTTTPEFAMVEQTIEDITLSSIRIQQALKIVSGIITESDQVRKDLYRRYRQDHQFHGYPGIKNPKGLLKALSQSQDF